MNQAPNSGETANCRVEIGLEELPPASVVLTNGVNGAAATNGGRQSEDRIRSWFVDKLQYAKREWRLICELALLILMILFVWGLLSLPVTFYYTTQNEVSRVSAKT